MTIHLTPEQEERIRAVMQRGSYDSVDEVMEAALVAVEQRATAPSPEPTESEFLDSLKGLTEAKPPMDADSRR